MTNHATLRSFTFRDFDAYASSIVDADVNIKLPRLDRSHWTMQYINFPDSINIQVAYEGSGSISAGAVQDDGFVLFVAEGDCQGNGVRIDRDSVLLMPPGKEFCNPSKGETEWLAVFIPYATAEATDLITSRDVIGNTARVIHPSRGTVERLRSLIKRYVAGAQVEPGLLQEFASVTSFRKALAESVKDCLFVDAAKSRRVTGRPRTVDAKLIASAIELIEDSPEATPTLPDLVEALGVSERSVRTGFQNYLGVSPQKYIDLSRLHRARKQLLTSSFPDATVTKVAAQLGMWDFGRFAARYQATFGERPSETLRQHKKSTSMKRRANPRVPGNASSE